MLAPPYNKRYWFLWILLLLLSLWSGCYKWIDDLDLVGGLWFLDASHTLLSTNIPCPVHRNDSDTCPFCLFPNRIPKHPKITALLAVRNVDTLLSFGIRHLAEFCDSIVVLDDHSNDQTLLELKLLSRYYPIEAVIYFASEWHKRDELRDRQILLAIGRMLRGTHFVVIDYDEIFAADCISQLRKHILQLPPGHSLYIPWIFPWNGTQYHAVPGRHTGHNLLNRSLVTIFADHDNLQYPNWVSTKKMSIHVDRIPHFPNGSKPTNRRLLNCKILDLRFLSLDNLERKLLWYDGLGRISNESRQVRGKVFRVNEMRQLCLQRIPPEWIAGYRYFDPSLFYNSDRWRCRQLEEWKRKYPHLFTEKCTDCKISLSLPIPVGNDIYV